MARPSEPDQTLIKMPSLRAVKSFVAAAKYGSFTRAAEALCVTQAAISRQIRELELYLGTNLFIRSGRTVKLSPSGVAFFDAAQLSFINISQAAERIRSNSNLKQSVTVCCSPAFSFLWLHRRLPQFFQMHPDIELRVIATQDFLTIESSAQPDIFITKMPHVRDGYGSVRLFHDWIYPVCSPQYLKLNPEVGHLQGILQSRLLDLNPYGRSQLAEHVDWTVWFAFHGIELPGRASTARSIFSSNDYNALVQLALEGQGVALGWHHLVAPLVESGQLVRPVRQEVIHTERCHYLNLRADKEGDAACMDVREWLLSQF